ncbi:unnamed protein product [Protopolystoma xenopodis]|uniref:Uncharacterized protein n=1 Tax=Protopolystoma xenopodis TaxID=117903 RepID=A0A3S5A202_9PLAT|nr:unnamed protein product [Protopolystoma xenopodis]
MSLDRHQVIILSREDAKPFMRLDEYYDIDRKYAKPGFKNRDGTFNWHCSCVSSYMSGPCGYFFRSFMSNVDKFVGNEDTFKHDENRKLFRSIHYKLMGCLKQFPTYYKSFIEDYDTPLTELLSENKQSQS